MDNNKLCLWEEEHSFRSAFHPVVKYFAQQRIEFLKKHILFQRIISYLDIGSGDGVSSMYLPGSSRVFVVDFSVKRLEKNISKNKVVCDCNKLPFKDNSFDAVGCWEVLHHNRNPERLIMEMKRVSKKYLYAFEPNIYNPAQFFFALLSKEHGLVIKQRYNLKNLKNNFCRSGIKVVLAKNVGWIFPNRTPGFLLGLFKKMPYIAPIAISCFVLGEKNEN